MERLKGVYPFSKKDGTLIFRSSFTFHCKHISLGSFDTMEEANAAYLDAQKLILQPQISIMDYSPEITLPFSKWVSIINFRDNRIYFSTPIYLRPTFFYYYLSPNLELKFDKDDLFYYSTKTIMRRNGHLFVADYGMQVNILNRYGIKNYSVLNRDYCFMNGDSTDFRYINIKIINRYNGVLKTLKKGKDVYKAKIHVRGDFVIGYYQTETEAAIAYNKAIDILKKNGIQKNYTPNFVDGISNAEYAHIYSALKISQKLQQLTLGDNQ